MAKSPENDNAYVALANIQLKMNQKPAALATLKKAIDLNPANKRQLPKNSNFKSFMDDPEFKKLFGS